MIYENSPRVLVQQDRVPAEVEARNDVHRLCRSRTADGDPKFSMIYYDNDQFCGEGIYYLEGFWWRKKAENDQLVVHSLACY